MSQHATPPASPANTDPGQIPPAEYGRPVWHEQRAITETIPALLAHAHEHFADNECVVFDDERITYRELEERSGILARQLLDAGIAKGTRVGVLFPSNPSFAVVWFALARIGAVSVTISTLSTPAELQRVAKHADLHLIMAAERYLNHDYAASLEKALPGISAHRADGSAPLRLVDAPHLRGVWLWGQAGHAPPAWAHRLDLSVMPTFTAADLALLELQASPSDVVSIIYTSGSTAEPKGVIHTHGNFSRQARKFASHFPYRAGDRVFNALPFFWVGGLTMHLLHLIRVGATVLGSAKNNAGVLDLIERERVTYVHVYPHVARALEGEPGFTQRDFSAVKGGRLVGAIPEHLRQKNQVYGNALGMTETGASHTLAFDHLAEEFTGSLGTPMPGMQHRIIELDSGRDVTAIRDAQGELQIRGDALMIGFVRRERSEVFDPDGWYRTGDLCSFREGHLFYHGRVDDMIKSSGANVSPREVESVLMGLPGVFQVYVAGVPDAKRGTVVGAIVVPATGHTLDADWLKSEAARLLSSYKVPRVLLVMDAADLPSTSSTKVDRRGVARLLQEAALKDSANAP